jgi:hypothetical protein
MIGFIDTSLQLQPIITAHNQWLSKTRSIPNRTTSVYISSVTNGEWWNTVHTLNCLQRRLPDESPHHLKRFLCYSVLSVATETRVNPWQRFGLHQCILCSGNLCLPNRCLAMDYSGFQASVTLYSNMPFSASYIFLAQSNSFLAISSQSSWTAISRTRLNYYWLLSYTPLYSWRYPTENTVFYSQECVFTGPLPSNGRPNVGSFASWECVYRPVA